MNAENKSAHKPKTSRPKVPDKNIYNLTSSPPKMYDDWSGKPAGDRDLLELQRASEEINRSNRRIMKQSFISDVLIISDEKDNGAEDAKNIEKPVSLTTKEHKEKLHTISRVPPLVSPESHKVNPDEDDWDSLYDENGDCLDPTLWDELTEVVGKVSIVKPTTDYRPYQNTSRTILSSEDSFAHVLEIYDFPPEFKTQDLLAVFAPYKSTGFEIKWVDDTHALAVFSSVKVAEEALAQTLPFVKTRPLREGTAESRQKARRSAEYLQPYKTRPETCTALARRLVSGALGVKLKTAQEERERERVLIKQARERKLLATRQRDDAWEEEDYAKSIVK